MPYDCVIAGAGPGGLQAAIYLCRYNFSVLILDRTGGRTRHARHVENYLGHREISGAGILDIGLEQAKGFGAEYITDTVTDIRKAEHFEVRTSGGLYEGRTVVVSSGVQDNLPSIEGLHRFLGRGFYTCVDCDGYRTTGRKLIVIGNHINTVRLALAMKKMYTLHVTLLLMLYDPPEDYKEELEEQGIPLVKGRAAGILGDASVEALLLEGGRRIECEAIMSNFGYKLNDGFISGLGLKRDAKGFKYHVNHNFESSLSGLYIVGPLNTGNDQIVIAAGEGATAAIDIKKRLMEL